jgi:hypothetical protein
MSILAKLLFSLTGPITVNQFEEQCRHPRRAQEALLRHILEKNKHTAFGRKHGFARIKTMRGFRKRVPICSYEELQPYIQAELQGKNGQLTAEKPELFAMTSGTTGDAKYIPVTPESRKAKSDLMKLWLSALFKDHPEILTEKILSVVSPEVEKLAPDGTPCGAESGHAYRNVPALVRGLYACPYEVYEIKDYEARYYTILRIAAAQSLSLIVAVNPSTLLVLCEHLAKHSRSIIRDVKQGGLSSRFPVEQPIREKIASYLKPNPERAAELHACAAQHKNKLVPKHIWPKLAALACWQGGTVGSYLEKIKPCFPEEIPIRDLGYLASEHRGSVPLVDDADAGVLAIATNVYEFFPADKGRKPRRNELLTIDQVEPGKRYFVYVTTLGGLYRYDMNDIVEVVGFHEKTPVIRFIQKGKGVVSFTGEKLSEAQVLAAVNEAFEPAQNNYEFISAVGETNGTARYAFLAEFSKAPPPATLKQIVQKLDASICQQNPEYASKRKSLRLGPPVLRVVRTGEFEKYRKQMVRGGRPDAQFKILRVTDDPEFARHFSVVREVEFKESRSSKRKPKR